MDNLKPESTANKFMKRVDQVIPQIVPAGKGSMKAADGKNSGQDATSARKAGRDHIDAINQVFAELELAYHNQFHKAFAQDGALSLAKKFWLQELGEFAPEIILRAVRKVVRQSEYLPTLAAVVVSCEDAQSLFGLPSARNAYIQACCAVEPRVGQQWSHPAVYLAGELTGWFVLCSEPESVAFPLFEYNYLELCRRVVHGEELHLPVIAALPAKVDKALSSEENLQRISRLRKQYDL